MFAPNRVAMNSSFAVSAVLLIIASNIQHVHAHGYLFEPESRNYIAKVEGREGSQRGVPKAEYCAQCLNRNDGLCGQVGTTNYDQWLDSTGRPMPWDSREIYLQGETITIKSRLTAHHGGHMELKACAMGRDSTQTCMDNHLLEFVSDDAHAMPLDSQYPERGYYFGGAGWNSNNFEMTFKLPNDLVGDKVLVQWRYITANSCNPPGYAEYFGRNGLSDLHWYPFIPSCPTPIPLDGDISKGPEQFFSCAEVTIAPNGESPQVTTAPISTAGPVPTDAPIPPITAAPVPVPTFPITSYSDDTPTGPTDPTCKSCAIGSVGPCQNADGACFAYRDEVNRLCWPGSFDCNTDDPTKLPTGRPSVQPVTSDPTTMPVTSHPTMQPTGRPTDQPVTFNPTMMPTILPTEQPVTSNPTARPTGRPTEQPVTFDPTMMPTVRLSASPSAMPESQLPKNPKCPPCFPGTSGECQKFDTVCWPYMDPTTKLCHPGTIDCTAL